MNLFDKLHTDNCYEDILLAFGDLAMRDFPHYRHCHLITPEAANHSLVTGLALRVCARCGKDMHRYREELESLQQLSNFIYWKPDETDQAYVLFHFSLPEEVDWMATPEGCAEHEASFLSLVKRFRSAM